MATPISWAQDIITCSLCENPTKQFCNDCQVSLCSDCVSQHVDKHKSLTHNIVSFKNREIQLVFSECVFHPNQRCGAFCQQCDVPVCIKCFLGHHKGHDAVELSNIVENKKEEIKKETKEIETVIIPKYQKSEVDIKNKASKYTARYDELEQETEKHRQLWHNEVDTIFNKLGSLIKSMKNENLGALETRQTELTSLIQEMKKTVEQNKEVLKTNRVSDVISFKSKLTDYRNTPTDCLIDMKIPSVKTNTVPGRELCLELGEYKATLKQKSLSDPTDEGFLSTRELLNKARVIATISTGVKPLWRVACVGADEAWVIGEDQIIRCFDIHGSLQDTVTTTCRGYPDDIIVSKQGDLMYGDAENRNVNVVRHGRTEVLITTPKDWTPRGLCYTRKGDILVYLLNGSQNKIVRYQGQTVKEEIYKDNNEKK